MILPGEFAGPTKVTKCATCKNDAFVMNPFIKKFTCGECLTRDLIRNGVDIPVPETFNAQEKPNSEPTLCSR